MLLSASSALRPRASACPGLFRIVPARDGGICRIKVPLGRLAGAHSRAVAEAATRFGSGIVEITNRSNLQIRGIAPPDTIGIAETLVRAELGPAHPDGDDIRNVMVNPTAGIDPDQAIDTGPMALALLDRLQADETCRGLSPKFCFLIDGGEEVAVVDHPHDVWLAAVDDERLAIGFAGCPSDDADGLIHRQDGVETAIAAARLFQEMTAGDPTITRLRHLLARHPRPTFVARLGLDAMRWRRRPARRNPVGIGRQRDGLTYVGAIAPLGRLTPAMLSGAATIAARYGRDELRLTPWQGLLVPSIRNADAGAVMDELKTLGFVCHADHPLASIVTCAGAPGCASGFSDTQKDGQALARMIPGGAAIVHLSGCAKSCASTAIADTTLVAVAPGRYDLYAKDGQGESRFGREVARSATLEQAVQILRNKA